MADAHGGIDIYGNKGAAVGDRDGEPVGCQTVERHSSRGAAFGDRDKDGLLFLARRSG